MEVNKDKLSFEEIQALIKATDKENPKPEDLKALKRHLNENDALVKLNAINQVAFTKAVEICSSSALLRELYHRQIEDKRKELGIETASPIEQILIDQIVICWFRLNHIEMIHAAKQGESHTFTSGIYWDKKLSSAQRRLLKACGALAKVKKLLAEADLKEQQARNKRSQSTLIAQKILENATK